MSIDWKVTQVHITGGYQVSAVEGELRKFLKSGLKSENFCRALSTDPTDFRWARGGRYSTTFYTERLRSEVKPLNYSFIYTILDRRGAPIVSLLLTNGTPFIYVAGLQGFRTLHPFQLL